jgi:hypothetical protein
MCGGDRYLKGRSIKMGDDKPTPTNLRLVHQGRKGHIQVLKPSQNLISTTQCQFTSKYQRASEVFDHKFWIKGWKRYNVQSAKVISKVSTELCWILKIKDMDDSHMILDQLKEVRTIRLL